MTLLAYVRTSASTAALSIGMARHVGILVSASSTSTSFRLVMETLTFFAEDMSPMS